MIYLAWLGGLDQRLGSFPARLVSWFLALLMSGIVLAYPLALAETPAQLSHKHLSLFMLLICGAFVHGTGFRLDQLWLRLVCGPLLIWPLILLYCGYYFL